MNIWGCQMGSKRIKHYLMRPIPEKMGGAGRFSAYFVGDDFSVDAFKEILPGVIADEGLKVSPGVGQQLITAFLKKSIAHTAQTGETVNVANLMTSMLAIKGSYERRKSSASKDNVRVVVRLLDELRPEVSFSMSNALAGKVVTLQSVTSPGCEPGFVKQRSMATLNGLNMEMLPGDSIIATMKSAAKEDVSIQCAYESAGSTRLDVTIPAEFNDPFYVGKEITFKIINRCGDPDSEQDSDTIKATMLAGDGDEPEPAPEPATVTLRTAVTEGMMDNNIRLGSEPITLEGENLTLGEGDKLYARNADYSDDDYVEIPSRFVSRNTATAIDLSEDSGDSLWAWLGEEVEFSEEHGRITFKLVSHGGVPSSEPQTVTVTAVVQFA